MSSNSLVKHSPANAIKISVAILNLVSFSLFDRCDSDKPEKKINMSLISGYCLWTLRDHKTLRDKNWDEFKSIYLEKKYRGVWGLTSEFWVFVTPDGLFFERLGVATRSSWLTFLEGAIDWGSLTSLFTVGLFNCGASWLVLEVSGASNRPTSLILLKASRRSDVKFPFFAIN